jgi:hypothetical protein
MTEDPVIRAADLRIRMRKDCKSQVLVSDKDYYETGDIPAVFFCILQQIKPVGY